MNSIKDKTLQFRWRRYAWIMGFGWTVIVAASASWNIVQVRNNALEAARIQARAAFEKDIIYRRWNANHGGVYVPITDETMPNPYLDFLENRDITATNGLLFTLINPAYMTRQVHELAEEKNGTLGHITSLNPIRPANAADAWETKALEEFELGELEVTSLAEINGREYMRLMQPLVTEEGCLQCHEKQGYEEGDIRGGISVSVPFAPINNGANNQVNALAASHSLLWLLGIIGVVVNANSLRKSELERSKVMVALEELATKDPLLECNNRRHFFSLARQELARAIRYKRNFSIMMIDLDHFKEVNDKYGHQVGDSVLIEMAKRIGSLLRETDVFGRYGGEEFAILLHEIDILQAKNVAERLREKALEPINVGHDELHISISLGVSNLVIGEEMDFDSVLERADQALMAAKRGGRNQVVVWSKGDNNKP